MNYTKVYNQLMDKVRSENRSKGHNTYYEAHHIIPRCLGGEGKCSEWKTHPNIILLTPKEHFVAHKLLFFANPGIKKLASAYWFFLTYGHHGEKNYRVSAREYAWLRNEYAKTISKENNPFFGKTHTEETREIISHKRKGKKFTQEQLDRLKESRNTPEYRLKISNAHKGIPVGEHVKKHLSEIFSGSGNPFFGKKHSESTISLLREKNIGKKLSDETKNKISKSHIGLQSGENHPMWGKKRNEEAKKKTSDSMMGDKNHFFGKQHSEETKKLLSQKNKGRKFTPEQSANLSRAMKGKPKSESFKQKLSLRMKNTPPEEWTCPHCGKEGKGSSNRTRWHFDKCKNKV